MWARKVFVASSFMMDQQLYSVWIHSIEMSQTTPATKSTSPPFICMLSVSVARLHNYCISGQIIVYINPDASDPELSLLFCAEDMVIHSWVQQQASIYYTIYNTHCTPQHLTQATGRPIFIRVP